MNRRQRVHSMSPPMGPKIETPLPKEVISLASAELKCQSIFEV